MFSELVQKCLRRRSAKNITELEQAIAQYLDRRNENPRPFRWKATVLEILRKVQRAWAVLHAHYGAKKPSAALASIEHRLAAEDGVAMVHMRDRSSGCGELTARIAIALIILPKPDCKCVEGIREGMSLCPCQLVELSMQLELGVPENRF